MVGKLKEHPEWVWFEAVFIWELGETDKLSSLVRSQDIPLYFKNFVGDIIQTNSRPNNKARARLKLTPTQWLYVHVEIYDKLAFIHKKLLTKIKEYEASEKTDPEIVYSLMLAQKRKLFNQKALELGLSYNTVKAAYKVFEKKLEHWRQATYQLNVRKGS